MGAMSCSGSYGTFVFVTGSTASELIEPSAVDAVLTTRWPVANSGLSKKAW